jgi:hypothetical protein
VLKARRERVIKVIKVRRELVDQQVLKVIKA